MKLVNLVSIGTALPSVMKNRTYTALWGIVCLLLAMVIRPALADVAYLYSGNTFNSFSSPTSYTTSNFITGTLSLTQPLPPNLYMQDISGYPGFSIQLRDGHQLMSATAGYTGGFEAKVSTDALGQIIGPWNFLINCCQYPNNGIATLNSPFGQGIPGARGLADQGVLTAPSGSFPSTPSDTGRRFSLPGTWTVGPYGTVTRTITIQPLTTSRDVISGGLGQLKTVQCRHSGQANACGLGEVVNTAIEAGAYATSGVEIPGSLVGTNQSGTSSGRGVAVRSWVNSDSVAKTFRANAVLSGFFRESPFDNFPTGNVNATAGVYILDSQLFSSAIPPTGLGEFLLSGDSLTAQNGAGERVSLATRFPLAARLASRNLVIANSGQFIDIPPGGTRIDPIYGQALTYSLSTDVITVQPGKMITLMFDVSSHSPSDGNGESNFISTLSPADNLFTDADGNPVIGMQALGPSEIPQASTAALTLSPPATASLPVGDTQTVTAMASDGGGAPLQDVLIHFNILSGPHAGLTGLGLSDANGIAEFTYTDTLGMAGTDMIQANVGALLSDTIETSWTSPGALDHITISPLSAAINAGGSQAYTAASFDKFNNSRGEVTSSASFSIAPDGSCTGASCTADIAGIHTVTGTHDGKTATASLTVNAVSSGYNFQGFFQPIDMSTSSAVVLNSAKAGQAIPVKWRLTQNGLPVSDPSSFARIMSYPVSCNSAAGSVEDAIEEFAPGASGLIYNGDGNWQQNWKTPKAYANTCRALVVHFSNGDVSPSANFKFK